MILPHDAGVEPNPAMTGGAVYEEGRRALGALHGRSLLQATTVTHSPTFGRALS